MIVRSLKECIIESLLDSEDEVFDGAKESVISIIKEFLNDNYDIRGSYTVNETKGRFIVDIKGSAEVTNKNITSLTNEFFEFGVVSEDFNCCKCKKLKSLKGAPKEVGNDFICPKCNSLKTLEGAPEKIGRDFACPFCDSLKTLEGAPKEVGKGFYCNYCESLTSLKGAPKKIGEGFYCDYCESLTSLKGAPKEVGGKFDCSRCATQFTEEDVKKYTTVSGTILV